MSLSDDFGPKVHLFLKVYPPTAKAIKDYVIKAKAESRNEIIEKIIWKFLIEKGIKPKDYKLDITQIKNWKGK